MFFSWYIKNKYFKRGIGLSGQVAPFLIIILAILLIAAISTVNIGRVAIDKTYSANGADAGSLAAASAWAGAFNQLTLINKDIKALYDVNYYTYGQLKFTADDYLEQAILYSALTTAAADAATAAMLIGDPKLCCPYSIPYTLIAAAVSDGLGAGFALNAQMATSAFNITIQTMQSLTDSFYEGQQQSYCAARAYMEAAYINAQRTGLSYAFANSGIPAKLSNAQDDAFSAWLAGSPSGSSGSYSWTDSARQSHQVAVTLDLPKITSYALEHTVGGYAEITELLDNLITRSQTIATVFQSVATILAAGAILNVVVFGLVAAAFVLYITTFGAAFAMILCGIVNAIYTPFTVEHLWVVTVLAGLVAQAGTITLALLGKDNKEAFADWARDGTKSSFSCTDVKDLMIVQIDDVTLPSWIATCVDTQTHPGSRAGIGIVSTIYLPVTSISYANFSGGLDDLRTFTQGYFSRLVENPSES